MRHIFTPKYIRDERELGEEAVKSSRNDLTCLQCFSTREQGSWLYISEKRVERDLVATKTVVVRRVWMVHSGQMPSDI